MGAKLGGKRPGAKRLGAKRLGEEMVWGRNDPDSPILPYPTELKWKVGVNWGEVGVNIGWVTLPYSTLRSSSGLLN